MSDDILCERLPGKGGDIGRLVLNRPKALNALNHAMCLEIKSALTQWQSDRKIKAVVICADGGRAFCAGGDVKSLYENRDDFDAMLKFFNDEYSMNKAIYHFKKPYISFLDGMTMGGGAGVSLHGSHRVATENFSFAMPETKIGFFPDVGGASFLNQCPEKFGMYLGLTGSVINAAEALALKLVDQVVSSKHLSTLLHTLCESKFSGNDFDTVTTIINRFKIQTGTAEILNQAQVINHCFAQNNVEDILDSLSEAGTSFSNQVARDLLSRAPSSLKVTFAHLNQAKELKFDEIMQMNFNMVSHFLEGSDFFEGVRAMVVDKDQKPRWVPPNISDVCDEEVAKFFIERQALV